MYYRLSKIWQDWNQEYNQRNMKSVEPASCSQKRLRDGVTRLWLYETSDGGGRSSITHIAVIPASVRHTPGSVPTEPFGIGNA
ncbi:hypothetical protein NW765_017097 [Fusarium oxysporum]|nr:hypothetical protein NW765_017097 [Fusarium oxysporum]